MAGVDVPATVEIQDGRCAIAAHVHWVAEVDEQQEQIRQVKERILKFRETIAEVKLVGLIEA